MNADVNAVLRRGIKIFYQNILHNRCYPTKDISDLIFGFNNQSTSTSAFIRVHLWISAVKKKVRCCAVFTKSDAQAQQLTSVESLSKKQINCKSSNA